MNKIRNNILCKELHKFMRFVSHLVRFSGEKLAVSASIAPSNLNIRRYIAETLKRVRLLAL